AEFAIPPGGHGNDVAYYYPTNGPPLFNNADFIKAFSHSFLDYAVSLNPNIKSAPTLTPNWRLWSGKTEMLFNKTAGGLPEIHEITTSNALLERC
ncbi:hypothetical protein H0H93_000396, partial [Arthromyces matolae]